VRSFRIAASVLALAGCDRVFGLDPITPSIDAPPLPKIVTGRVVERYASNNASFQPIVMDRVFAPGTIALSATLDDGTLAAVDYQPDGTFQFPLNTRGQRYRFVATADGNTAELQLTSPQLNLAFLVAGRPNARPIGPTNLVFSFPGPVASYTGAFITTTGQWSQSYTGQFGPTVTYPWMEAQESGGVPLGLLDASAFDRAYVIQLYVDFATPGGGPNYEAINAASATSISQEIGVNSVLNPPAATTFDTCVHMQTKNATEYARLTAALLPRTYLAYSDWLVFWVPDADQLGTTGGQLLAASTLTGAPPDLDIAPSMAVPYPGGNLIAFDGAFAIFNVVAPGATNALQLYNGGRRYQKATPGAGGTCAGSTVSDLTGTVGIADTPLLNGTRLDALNQLIPIDHAHPATVTWSIAGQGPVDMTSVVLFELVAINGDSVMVNLQSVQVVDQVAQLDSSLLVPGHMYVVSVTTSLGRPDAASGDFTHIAYPLANLAVWSQPFVVASM
jgi:hypothetical protein